MNDGKVCRVLRVLLLFLWDRDSLLFAQKEEEMCLSTATRVGSKQWRLILKQSTSSLFLLHHFSQEFREVAILVMQSICI